MWSWSSGQILTVDTLFLLIQWKVVQRRLFQCVRMQVWYLTGAGSPFPYGKDPEDKNIRIAPSFATPDELKEASEILIICTKITALEKILGL